MSNRQLSSKKNTRKQSPRSPLRDLNGFAGSDTGSSSSARSSSSMSVEAPTGCLRFFLSNASASRTPPLRPKATPNSAPNAKPSKLSSSSSSSSSARSKKTLKGNPPKPSSQKDKPNKNPPCLYQWQSLKKPPSRTALKPKPPTCSDLTGDSAFGSEELSQDLNNLKQLQKQCATMAIVEPGEPPKLLNLPDLSTGPVENCTPVAKLARGSVLRSEYSGKLAEEDTDTISAATATTTPPVQPSVSPEIQCGSSALVSTGTPACYGAGHMVSGITDRRKCRARGILTVGEIEPSCGKTNNSDNYAGLEMLRKSRVSLVPLPVEASMRWLLSPCDEEDEDQKSDPENGFSCIRKSLDCLTVRSSPSSGNIISSDICNNMENSRNTITNSRRRNRITLLSPTGNFEVQGGSGSSSAHLADCSLSFSPHATSTCQLVSPKGQRKHRYELDGKNSPFSIDSLGSGNVIQTPQSDMSSDRHAGLSWLNPLGEQLSDFGSEIDPVAEDLLRASLSPKTRLSIWDPIALNYRLSDLISPSNSIDFTQFPNTQDNRACCTSSSTFGDISESHMRISWRDGLVSRIFEMDEFDCCRCLSDDENDTNDCSNPKFRSNSNDELNADLGDVAEFSSSFEPFGSPEFNGCEAKSNGEIKENFPLQRSNPCAESICTDTSGLVDSGDSDWTSCYKNQLFKF